MTLYNCDVVSSVWTAIKAHTNTNQGSKSVHFSFFFFLQEQISKSLHDEILFTQAGIVKSDNEGGRTSFIKVWKSILASWIGLGITGHLMIRYYHDKWLTVTIISRYCDSAIINISRKSYNDTSRYLSKQNACEKVKCTLSFFIQVKLLENIS